MSRTPTGWQALPRAMEQIKKARTIDELCIAQAVVLPLEHGLTLKDTAMVIGRTASWVARMRRQFIAGETIRVASKVMKPRGGRRNQLMPEDEEDALMRKVCEDYVVLHRRWRNANYPIVDPTLSRSEVWQPMRFYVQRALQERLRRTVPVSSVYNLMSRTALRKFGEKKTKQWEKLCYELI